MVEIIRRIYCRPSNSATVLINFSNGLWNNSHVSLGFRPFKFNIRRGINAALMRAMAKAGEKLGQNVTPPNSAGMGSVRKARYIFASYFYVIGVITQVRPGENDDLSFIFTLFVPVGCVCVGKL